MLWLRGRTNPAVGEFCREHNRRVARMLLDLASAAGLVVDPPGELYLDLAVEAADRMLQIAFESSLEGSDAVVEQAVEMVTRYLEPHARTRTGTGR